MHLESLITCVAVEPLEFEGSSAFHLSGVFRTLERSPEGFLVFLELRGHSGALRIRCRVQGMTGDSGTWYESWDELTLTDPTEDAHALVFELENADPPVGRSVIEALLDGRVVATRVVDFKS